MKTIALSRGKVAVVDDCDFAYLNQWKWYFRDGYAVRMSRTNGRRTTIRMHRVVCERAGFQMNGLTGDHRNWDTLDNRRSNLRPATKHQQKQHTRCRKDSHTGCKGATK